MRPHDRHRDLAAERPEPGLDRPRDDRAVPGHATASSRSRSSSPTRSSALRIEGPVFAIHQSDATLDAMDAWNKGTHGRSGLIDRVKASTIDEAQAEAQVIEFLQQLRAEGQDRRCAATASARTGASSPTTCRAGGVLPLPQPRRQHAEGAGAALEARRRSTASRRRRRTPRWPTSTSRSTSSRTTGSTCWRCERARTLRANPNCGRIAGLAAVQIAAIRSSPLTSSTPPAASPRGCCSNPRSAREWLAAMPSL